MTSRKYKLRSTDELTEEFKKKASAFNRNLRGLEDSAKKCESLKWLDKQSSSTVLSKGDSGKYLLDWQPYLNDGKRKLSRTLAKLKEIQNHRKQRRISFIGSFKEALPSWAKKKSRGNYIQLHQLINDTEDYESLIADIVQQINSADELSNLVIKIFQQRDSNQNDQLSKDQQDLSNRWNALNINVINKSNSLESLGLEVDHEYRKLNEWYEKENAFRPWLDSTEKTLNEESATESNIPATKERLNTIRLKIKECQSRKLELQQINGDADILLDSGRLDQGDTERVGRINENLSNRYMIINDKLVETQSKLYGSIHQLKKKPGEKTETLIVEDSVKPNHMPPRKIFSPFHKDEDNTNEHKINDSMKAIKRLLGRAGTRSRTERETERIHDESVKAFNVSLDTCEKTLNELDEESLHNFSAVGSTVKEVREQLDEIQVLEQNMAEENKHFSLVKETFNECQDTNLMSDESYGRLHRKVDDLNSRWEEMWRSHDVNKDRLVQAILIMGGQWMGRVKDSLDQLEDDMNSVEIQEDNLEALREAEQSHKEIMKNIISHENSVDGAVDVAREVHRRDLVTDETGETIQQETQALEDRLDQLIDEAEKKKERISVALRNAEKANMVDETMVATNVIAVHSAPDESSETDEGFVEPKQHFFKRKVTYESLINQKIKEFKKESREMNDWMDETERLVNSLSVDMDPQKATKIQQKINKRYEEVQEKKTKVVRIVQLSMQIENETLDPSVSGPMVKEADAIKERWSKNKEMIENYGEKDAGSKAGQSSCCIVFLKKRLFPAWSYN